MYSYKRHDGALNYCLVRNFRDRLGWSRVKLSNELLLLGLDLTDRQIEAIELNKRTVKEYELYYFSIVFNCAMEDLIDKTNLKK